MMAGFFFFFFCHINHGNFIDNDSNSLGFLFKISFLLFVYLILKYEKLRFLERIKLILKSFCYIDYWGMLAYI